jgi:hypothetical protein
MIINIALDAFESFRYFLLRNSINDIGNGWVWLCRQRFMSNTD